MTVPPAVPRLVVHCLLLLLCTLPLPAAEPVALDPKLLDGFPARPLGPAIMGGRITDIAVVESKPSTFYVAAASGGLWKTTNNGSDWTPVFDQQPTQCLGAVAVAPSNPDIVWVGTGEANARNSVSWGDGVYKSTDGGKTWTNTGLKETHHIGKIVIHPKNPDIVYVAAVGRFWGPNKERGLYKTSDGGKTWVQSKYLNENTGFIDIALDPADPETLYACAYQVRRDAYSGGNPAIQTGPEAGIYKTTDGGKSWNRLGGGLPERPLGRCGVAVWARDPRIVYAVVQTDRTILVRETEWGQPAKINNKPDTGGVFRSADAGKTWTKLNDLCPRPFYYSQIRIDPADSQRIYVLGVSLHVSLDGGQTFRDNGAPRVHGDHHALWIDPADPTHLVLGNDGGLYASTDRGKNWEQWKNLPIGQFYGIALDTRQPYRIYGGLQDNGSWGGPSATHYREGIPTSEWFRIATADGFQVQVDQADPDTVYAEAQYGLFLKRINVHNHLEKDIKPPKGRTEYRYNWSTPILLSPHNPRTLYYGANHVLRSRDRGDNWEVISPDLTRGPPGPSADNGHTITTIAESPLKAGLLWVGSDDGRVHVSKNGGTSWTDLSDKVPGLPPERWITRIECSHFAEGTAYLAIDRHRNDDRTPYLFKTTDYGATWSLLSRKLPPGGPIHVVREDLRNPELLFVGTEFGLFLSLDGGESWQRPNNDLPPVAVHDLALHPRERDLVIATHGRSLWVIDVQPLEQLTSDVLAETAHLFEVKRVPVFAYLPARSPGKEKLYVAPNPPFGARIYYYLKNRPAAAVRVLIADEAGKQLATLTGAEDAGLHEALWNLRPDTPAGAEPAALVAPGEYTVRIEIGERTLTRKFRVEAEK